MRRPSRFAAFAGAATVAVALLAPVAVNPLATYAAAANLPSPKADIVVDAGTGRIRSWLRDGDTPKVTVVDPLQAHVDHLTKWTDAEMHNMTAYLTSLK